LPEAAGVNFPYLLYLASAGEPVGQPPYAAGVTLRFLPTLLASAWGSFRSAPWTLTGWAPQLGYLIDPRVREGLVCLDDLRPAIAYLRSRQGEV
jgi:hypothetical protein